MSKILILAISMYITLALVKILDKYQLQFIFYNSMIWEHHV